MNGRAYYNEHDPFCAQWLRNLIAAGLIAPGDVDERSIEDVRPSELRRYSQWHLFAGCGVWSYALRLAGWSDGRPVITCSCPCQPFSAAGKGAGFEDQRHLWPAAFHIIRELGVADVFGEQVANATKWLRLVRSDMECAGYRFASFPIEAASAGADHLRDRIFFVADDCDMRFGRRQQEAATGGEGRRPPCPSRAGHPGAPSGHWIADAFGKKYRFPRDLECVVDGLANGVATLRAIGNAVDPRPAAAFIRAYLECGMKEVA